MGLGFLEAKKTAVRPSLRAAQHYRRWLKDEGRKLLNRRFRLRCSATVSPEVLVVAMVTCTAAHGRFAHLAETFSRQFAYCRQSMG